MGCGEGMGYRLLNEQTFGVHGMGTHCGIWSSLNYWARRSSRRHALILAWRLA